MFEQATKTIAIVNINISESEKLSYEISFGSFSDEYDQFTKEEFLAKSLAILNNLQERNVPFQAIEIKAEDLNRNLQSVHFTKNSTEQELINSYQEYSYLH